MSKKGIHFKGERTKSTLIIVAGLIVFLVATAANITAAYTLILAAVSAAATYELTKAVGAKCSVLLVISCIVSAVTVCFVGFGVKIAHMEIIYSIYAIIMLMLNVILNQKIKYTDTVMALFASVAVPYSFSCFIRLNTFNNAAGTFSHWEQFFFVCMAFACSWLPDSFAFLVGRKFGKHKMTPNISPKKSVEGAIGGLLITSALNVFILFCFALAASRFGHATFITDSPIKYLVIIPITWVLAIVSMFGDLSASVLKRNAGIKDYSNLLPGHGGIMDRFDSTLFVLPTLYAILSFIF